MDIFELMVSVLGSRNNNKKCIKPLIRGWGGGWRPQISYSCFVVETYKGKTELQVQGGGTYVCKRVRQNMKQEENTFLSQLPEFFLTFFNYLIFMFRNEPI